MTIAIGGFDGIFGPSRYVKKGVYISFGFWASRHKSNLLYLD